MAPIVSEEQEALIEAVRGWLAARTDLARSRSGEPGLPAPGKPAGAAELGLIGLLREDSGGTHADLALVVEELGRAGSPLPMAQAALVCGLLDEQGLDPALADELVAAETLVVPALPDPDGTPVSARDGADGTLSLTGRAPFVVGGATADHYLVPAVRADGSSVLALVAAGDCVRTARTGIDLTRDLVSVEFAKAPAASWKAADTAFLEDVTALHHAADALGAADRLLEMTVRYVKERRQFGRVIGGFQAVKHHCANMALDVETARAAVRAAAEAPEDRAGIASAVSFVKEACSRVAGTALQLHGGMGFTWEHDLHLFLRRIKADELLGGTPRAHRARLADLTV